MGTAESKPEEGGATIAPEPGTKSKSSRSKGKDKKSSRTSATAGKSRGGGGGSGGKGAGKSINIVSSGGGGGGGGEVTRPSPVNPAEDDNDCATGSTTASSSGGSHHGGSEGNAIIGAGGGGIPQQMLMSNTHDMRSVAGGSSHVTDDSVQVNLAMADLMAYLQVVANNSQNLPLTRRDDPELGRTVSTLTAEEYARKAAAFIPSDVRIIGGSFTRYGRVWDLPTSEEYNPADGAQEPGCTSGGACCNAMLKVLYDTDSEAADAMAQNALVNPDKLFDDDESCLSGLGMPSKSFDMSLTDMATASTITWAELLRKMKVEMQSNGYSQVPTVTSSRKFDLSKPFSLVSPEFDPLKNKKRSLLIGCNYSDSAAYIKASHDDIRSVKDFIVNVHGFPEEKGLMTILLDDDEHKSPTHMNVTEAFKALSEQSQPGDAVFIQFSGHGCRVLDSAVDSQAEGYDEAIIPSDYSSSGLIRDTLLFKTLLAPMRYGVTVTCVFDSCETGVMIDLPYSWSTKSDRPEVVPKMSLNDDFSFVRFLKVVKTLYETSTFTQLGNVVGSALHYKPQQNPVAEEEHDSDAEDTVEVGSLMTMEEHRDFVPEETKATNNIMSSLAACIVSPKAGNDKSQSKLKEGLADKNANGNKARDDQPSVFKNTSLFQKVLNCTLAHDEEESVEERVFRHTNTLDDTLDGDEQSFDHTLDNSLSGPSATYDTWDDGDGSDANSPVRGRSRTARR